MATSHIIIIYTYIFYVLDIYTTLIIYIMYVITIVKLYFLDVTTWNLLY